MIAAMVWSTAAVLLLTSTPGPQRTIASKQFDPQAVAADAASIFWITGNAIMQSRLAKGSPSRLVFSPWAKALVIDQRRVYWRTTTGSYYDEQKRERKQIAAIWSVPRAGGKPTMLAQVGDIGASWFAIDADRAYWIGEDGISAVPLSGGSIQVLVPKRITFDLVVAGPEMYWREYSGKGEAIFSCSTKGGEPTLVAAVPDGIASLLVSRGEVFWTTQAGKLMRSPGASKDAAQLAAEAPLLRALAADSGSIYGLSDCCTLVRVPRAGGALERLYSSDLPVAAIALTEQAACASG